MESPARRAGAALALEVNSSDLKRMKGSPRAMLLRLAQALRG
jgi:hypothetical protein